MKYKRRKICGCKIYVKYIGKNGLKTNVRMMIAYGINNMGCNDSDICKHLHIWHFVFGRER